MAVPAEHIAYSSIVEALVDAGSFRTLLEAIREADLTEMLSGGGPYTVFAPTDEAFAKVPADVEEALLHDKRTMREILKYHVVPGEIGSSDIARLGSVRPLKGMELSFYEKDGAVTVGGARFVQTDIRCSNGIIHAVDTVLTP
jgi:uncharacterized surface protein with fasciclin (FAS1) repeats